MSFYVYDNTGNKMNFQITLLPNIDNYWFLNIYKEEKYNKRDLYNSDEGRGWESLLSAMNQYFNIPARNTPEYKNLLTE